MNRANLATTIAFADRSPTPPINAINFTPILIKIGPIIPLKPPRLFFFLPRPEILISSVNSNVNCQFLFLPSSSVKALDTSSESILGSFTDKVLCENKFMVSSPSSWRSLSERFAGLVGRSSSLIFSGVSEVVSSLSRGL